MMSMSTQDGKILNPNGGRYPFKVSDEYFENLTARIMERIPEETTLQKETKVQDSNRGRRRMLWIGIVSAAASLALIITVALKFFPVSTSSATVDELTAEYTDDDYNKELMSYVMADNMAVYDYLSGDMDE